MLRSIPRPIAALLAVVLMLAGVFGGVAGVAYAAFFAALVVPGLPIGRALFGLRHPGGFIAGALLGYGLSALALWVPIAAGAAWWLPFLLAWGVLTVTTRVVFRPRPDPLIVLPRWGRDTTLALALVLLLVPVLVVFPYSHLGQRDSVGGRRYRAYFTADFVWHEALTAELARFASPPRNPYLANRPLHYYWTYFLPPAVASGVARTTISPDVSVEALLKVNALGTGVLAIAAIFLAAWAAVPRAWPAAVATALALLASSAEGLYMTILLWTRGLSLAVLRDYNIDATTYWRFRALTVDGLTRSIWYSPHHSMACALGLIALAAASRSGAEMTAPAAAVCGLALALALTVSPFPAGVLTLVYATAVLWCAAARWRLAPRIMLVQLAAVAPVGVGLWWCLANGTFEGSSAAIAFGMSGMASRTGPAVLCLALGPLLLPTVAGLLVAASLGFPRSIRPGVSGAAIAMATFYGVRLVPEPIWIGWRAGQVFLVTAPALVALAVAAAASRFPRALVTALVTTLLIVGLPTTIVDVYNAQDTSNVDMGPGFRWTVVLTPSEQDALAWIDRQTPADAIVQSSVRPRGRDTWSLIPSFGHRRMAAGLPISLLRSPEYESAADKADRLFATADPAEAWRLAREMNISYLYVGAVERESFGGSAAKFDARPDLFEQVFRRGDVAVYAIADTHPPRSG